MPDFAMIQGAITGLKTAADIAKGFLELKSIADVQGKVIELQSAILSAQSSALAAQSEQSSMIQTISDLKEEIARIEAWEETKKRYKLVALVPGVFLYGLKRECELSEPAHWICTNCYEKGIKQIIHKDVSPIDGNICWLVCPSCKTKITMPRLSDPYPTYA